MKRVAESTVRRLSVYLSYLEGLNGSETTTVSSDVLAGLVGTTSAQVRKDLSFFGSFGKRGMGYSVAELQASIREILGVTQKWRVVIVGAGKIGIALAQYPGFATKGFQVTAVYDTDPKKIGSRWDSLVVRDVAQLSSDADQQAFDIGVIAVPAEAGQQVADLLVESGVKALMNFAPVQITTPPDVIVRTVNMVVEFEGLSYALAHRTK